MLRLFTSGQIGRLTVRNRIVMPAMVLNFPTADGEATESYQRVYGERARGGAGLIVVGAAYVHPAGRGFPGQLGVHTDALLPALRRLTDAIHAHGAAAFLQLSLRFRERGPADFTTAEIGDLIRAYAAGARRAQQAGFDGVELHACHDYLLHHFLSPLANRRTDEFGGDVGRRSKLLLEVIRAVKHVTGDGFPVGCRLSADEFLPGGLRLPESGEIAARARAAGADVIHVSAGVGKTTEHMIPPMEMPSGALLPLAAAMRRAAGPPVIAAAKIDTLELAEEAVSGAQADFVAMGRSLLADPHLPRKYQAGTPAEVRPCIRCNVCVERIRGFQPAACTVNPVLGREGELKPAESPGEIAVIGGGPAGAQAALTLAARGQRPVLWEREAAVGGKLLVGSIPPHKQVLSTLTRHFGHMLDAAGVRCHLGSAFEQWPGPHPRTAILATGGRLRVPRIPGMEAGVALPAQDLLRDGPGDRRRFLVVGGGLVGLETAEFLMAHGKRVVVIEQLEAVGQGLVALRRDLLLGRLVAGGVEIRTGTRLVRLEARVPVVQTGGAEHRLEPFDTMVLAVGYEPDRRLADWAQRHFERVVTIGDAREPRGILEAVTEGYEAAASL